MELFEVWKNTAGETMVYEVTDLSQFPRKGWVRIHSFLAENMEEAVAIAAELDEMDTSYRD